MKVAIIGSRGWTVSNMDDFIPMGTSEIISGGAVGVDKAAETAALRNGLKLTVYLPDYRRYGRGAPLKRNIEIIEHADIVLVFWDGTSKGTKHVIENCRKRNNPYKIYLLREHYDDTDACTVYDESTVSVIGLKTK